MLSTEERNIDHVTGVNGNFVFCFWFICFVFVVVVVVFPFSGQPHVLLEDIHNYMNNMCEQEFSDSNFNYAVNGKISIFQEITPNFTNSQKL